jgi:Tfp pilus assembly protein PilE
MRRSGFPLLETSIVLSAIVLVWLLAYPQHKEGDRRAKRYEVMVNTYTLRAAIENYAAYNEGKFPMHHRDFKEFFTPLSNPYQARKIEAEDITVFEYKSRDEAKEHSVTSRNGRMSGEPGGLAYGYFAHPDDSTATVVAYGIIGFDDKGIPLAEKLPSGQTKLFVIYE